MADSFRDPAMKLGHPITTKESEHGPPSDPRFMNVKPNEGGAACDEKDAEIARLKNEVHLYRGKIRGFQTIVHILQETKQECSLYKQKNEQLSLQIDQLKRVEASHDLNFSVSSNILHPISSSIGPDYLTGLLPTELRTGRNFADEINLDVSMMKSNGEQEGKSLTEDSTVGGLECDDPEGTETRKKSGNVTPESSASSQSFVEISNLQDDNKLEKNDADKQFLQSIAQASNAESTSAALAPVPQTSASNVSTTTSALSTTVATAPAACTATVAGTGSVASTATVAGTATVACTATVAGTGSVASTSTVAGAAVLPAAEGEESFSALVLQLKEYLVDKDESKVIPSEVFRITVPAVVKLEKQCRQQQVLLDQVNLQVVSLKSENERLLSALQAQHRLDLWTEKQSGSPAPVLSPSPSSDVKSLMWVDMRNERSSSPLVTAEPVELRDSKLEVERLKGQIQEMKASNRQWQEKMLELEERYKLRLAASLDEERRQLQVNLEVRERIHEEERISLTTELKKCSIQLEEERKRRMEAEEQAAAMTQRVKQLERDIMSLSNFQLEPVDYFLSLDQNRQPTHRPHEEQQQQQLRPLREEQQQQADAAAGAAASGASSMFFSENELKNQLLLLRQQVTIFKEDFDQERRDREKAKNEAEDYRKQIGLLNIKIVDIMEQLQKGQHSFSQAQKENDRLKEHLHKMSKHFKTLQNQMKSTDVRVAVLRSPTRRHHSTATKHERRWPCHACTFENIEESTTCEMCGIRRLDHHAVGGTIGSPELYQCDASTNQNGFIGRAGGATTRRPTCSDVEEQ